MRIYRIYPISYKHSPYVYVPIMSVCLVYLFLSYEVLYCLNRHESTFLSNCPSVYISISLSLSLSLSSSHPMCLIVSICQYTLSIYPILSYPVLPYPVLCPAFSYLILSYSIYCIYRSISLILSVYPCMYRSIHSSIHLSCHQLSGPWVTLPGGLDHRLGLNRRPT